MYRGVAKGWKTSVAAFAVLTVAWFAGWEVAQEVSGRGLINNAPLRNYGIVWENRLTRSGIPRFDSGWKWLRDQGVKSIVTFRPENDIFYEKFGFERVLRLPMRDDPPSDAEAERFLRFIQDPNNQPVHIHCTAGKDRTGMMTALARYSIDGWRLDQALAEARVYRGGKDLAAKRVQWLKDWAARHKPGSFRTATSSIGAAI